VTNDIWNLFPFPTSIDGNLIDGSIHPVHPDCRSCSSQGCLSDGAAQPTELKICRYGLTYARIDDSRVLLGVVSSNADNQTASARRRNRNEAERRVRPKDLIAAISQARGMGPGFSDDFAAKKDLLIEEMKRDPDLQKAVAQQFRGEYEDSLNQSHDFLQLMNLVRGNAENLLHAAHPGMDVEEAAEIMPEIGAIYFSALLMRMKMDSLLYLHEINKVHGGERRFEIHPFVLKYVRIYNWQANQKNLRLVVVGNCRGRVRYNNDAIGSIVQGLLDNMVKYAPPGSTATVAFNESPTEIEVSFKSLGPRIESDEIDQIFMPKYRARAARQAEAEGQGIGLAAVKQVSDALMINAEVSQESEQDSKYRDRFLTTFSFKLRVAL
jgi:hypothetical protein